MGLQKRKVRMPAFEDDDVEDYRSDDTGRAWGADQNDEWDDPDERDLAPDEMDTVRCTRCRKWIIGDSVRCPYCKELQLADLQNRKPFWFVIAVVLGLLGTLTWFVLGTPSWFHL